MHQHNNICVGALNFDPWCTLNLISSHDHFQGLSLLKAPGVKIGCINTTFLVLEHSILTLGALLTYYLANTSPIITSQASHRIGATNPHRSRDSMSPVYGIFFKGVQILFYLFLWRSKNIFLEGSTFFLRGWFFLFSCGPKTRRGRPHW